MSGLTGKKNSTLRKEQVKESKLLATGVKSIKFWHEATAGETSIAFGSLSMPSDVSANGLSNPSSAEILAANLALFHTNVEVFSSLNQKLMEGLSYVVQNAQVKFVNGYTSTEGEIFEVNYKNDVITGTNVVDARPLTATDVLTAGNTDFNVGESFKTNAYPTVQMGEVIVFVDGIAQFRNVGNATAAPAADGNYEEVHAANGQGVIIRFNDVFAVDVNIVVISRNLIAERPDISMMQLIENLGGQLDAVISTTAALAGVPETDFQTAANQIDLRAFGNAVVANTTAIAGKHDQFQIDHQTKILSTNVGTTTTDISDLKFNNLEIGKTYRISGQVGHTTDDTNGHSSDFKVNHDSNVIARSYQLHPSTGTLATISGLGDTIFTATATTVICSWTETGSTLLRGDGTRAETYVTLEELPNHIETSKWV